MTLSQSSFLAARISSILPVGEATRHEPPSPTPSSLRRRLGVRLRVPAQTGSRRCPCAPACQRPAAAPGVPQCAACRAPCSASKAPRSGGWQWHVQPRQPSPAQQVRLGLDGLRCPISPPATNGGRRTHVGARVRCPTRRRRRRRRRRAEGLQGPPIGRRESSFKTASAVGQHAPEKERSASSSLVESASTSATFSRRHRLPMYDCSLYCRACLSCWMKVGRLITPAVLMCWVLH